VTYKTIRALGLVAWVSFLAAPALPAAGHAGKISGVVVDPRGTPQMGATVFVASELAPGSEPVQLLTNDRGLFSTEGLAAGLYSVRASLAGFLPAVAQHIHVTDARVTKLEIELGTVFSTLDKFSRPANQPAAPDEWAWVLRTSAATRPILRWEDGHVVLDGQVHTTSDARSGTAHGRVELSSGTQHPGSVANSSDAPATAFAYDQRAGYRGHLVFAGQIGYESASASGGLAAEWLPTGDSASGPVMTLVVRESQLGPTGPWFRGARAAHSDRVDLGDRIHVRYGGEYVVAGFTRMATSLRPHGELAYEVSPDWIASIAVASAPEREFDSSSGNLDSAMSSLDAFPVLMVHDGRPVLENDLHEELAVEHSFGHASSLTAAVFHDRSKNTAVTGEGDPTSPEYLQDFYSDAFAYDAGISGSWGSRIVYEQKISDALSGTLIYSRSAALVPDGNAGAQTLRGALAERERQSVAGRINSRLPRVGTELTVGYKWINGRVVSRQDSYGEAVYHVAPYLSAVIRQPLPRFIPGHPTAIADFGNLLAQGYVPITTRDGRVVLVPCFRSFRGGVSFQF